MTSVSVSFVALLIKVLQVSDDTLGQVGFHVLSLEAAAHAVFMKNLGWMKRQIYGKALSTTWKLHKETTGKIQSNHSPWKFRGWPVQLDDL